VFTRFIRKHPGLMVILNLVSVLIALPLLRKLHKEFFTNRRTAAETRASP